MLVPSWSRSSIGWRSCDESRPTRVLRGARLAGARHRHLRLKLDLGVQATEVAADEEAGPIARAFVAYEAAIAETGGLDFDDLVARALRTLRDRRSAPRAMAPSLRSSLVDEAQDLDRAQLRLALLLACTREPDLPRRR